MFSEDDNSAQRIVLGLVLGVVALVVALLALLVADRQVSRMTTQGVVIPVAVAELKIRANAAPPPTSFNAAQAAIDSASVRVEQGIVRFYFASGRADLAAGAGEALTGLIQRAQPDDKLAVSGFHDATGDAVKNLALARRRALTVRDALLAAGVAERRIDIKKPQEGAGSGSEAEARRVEISLEP